MACGATAPADDHAGGDHGDRGDLRLSRGDCDSRVGERVARRQPVCARVAVAADDRDRAARQRACCCCRWCRSRVGQRGFTGWRAALPSTAFVGAYETATGGFLADLPRRTTDRRGRPIGTEPSRAIYAERRPTVCAAGASGGGALLGRCAARVLVATALNALGTPSHRHRLGAIARSIAACRAARG